MSLQEVLLDSLLLFFGRPFTSTLCPFGPGAPLDDLDDSVSGLRGVGLRSLGIPSVSLDPLLTLV